MVSFEWDEEKNELNQIKHQISFDKAQDAFYDKDRLIFEDLEHSTDSEKRFFCIGKVQYKIITVRFTMRNKNIRIIGAGYWRKGKNSMNNNNDYSDDFEGILGKQIKDFLPSPEQLVKKQKMQRVTMEVPSEVIDFFKEKAQEHKGSYQSMIRELLLHYVKEYRHS